MCCSWGGFAWSTCCILDRDYCATILCKGVTRGDRQHCPCKSIRASLQCLYMDVPQFRGIGRNWGIFLWKQVCLRSLYKTPWNADSGVLISRVQPSGMRADNEVLSWSRSATLAVDGKSGRYLVNLILNLELCQVQVWLNWERLGVAWPFPHLPSLDSELFVLFAFFNCDCGASLSRTATVMLQLLSSEHLSPGRWETWCSSNIFENQKHASWYQKLLWRWWAKVCPYWHTQR